MFQIYSEHALQQRLRLKRVQVLAVFVAGAASGLWLAKSDLQTADAQTFYPRAVLETQSSTCSNSATTLRLDCQLGEAVVTARD